MDNFIWYNEINIIHLYSKLKKIYKMKTLIYSILIFLILFPLFIVGIDGLPLNTFGKIYELILLSLLGLFYYINDYEPIVQEKV